jgi:hypothetical protein
MAARVTILFLIILILLADVRISLIFSTKDGDFLQAMKVAAKLLESFL